LTGGTGTFSRHQWHHTRHERIQPDSQILENMALVLFKRVTGKRIIRSSRREN
jgi:hypothetical protein